MKQKGFFFFHRRTQIICSQELCLTRNGGSTASERRGKKVKQKLRSSQRKEMYHKIKQRFKKRLHFIFVSDLADNLLKNKSTNIFRVYTL